MGEALQPSWGAGEDAEDHPQPSCATDALAKQGLGSLTALDDLVVALVSPGGQCVVPRATGALASGACSAVLLPAAR